MNIFKLDIFAGLSFAAPCLDSTHAMGLVMFFAMPGVLCGASLAAFLVAALLRCCYKQLHPMRRRCIRHNWVMKTLQCTRYTTGSALTAMIKLVVTACLFIYVRPRRVFWISTISHSFYHSPLPPSLHHTQPGMCNKFFTTFKCIELSDGQSYVRERETAGTANVLRTRLPPPSPASSLLALARCRHVNGVLQSSLVFVGIALSHWGHSFRHGHPSGYIVFALSLEEKEHARVPYN